MRTASVSVVIPTYQRREVVLEAVRALSACEYDGSLELIVVVDGSTDGTADALRNVACPFPVKLIEQANAGAASARNRGAAEAKGEILLFLDDDMMAAPNLVAEHVRSHAAGAEAVLGHIPLDPASPPSILTEGYGPWVEERAERLANGGQLQLFDLLTGQLSVRRALFEELGGFEPGFTAGGSFGNEDIDFGVRLLERARVDFNPDAVSYQHYVVSAGRYLDQWADAGRADVRFARKHPGRAAELFALHSPKRWTARLLVRPLAATPGLAGALGRLAARAAARENRRPTMFRPLVRRLFRLARELRYWDAVEWAGGMPTSERLLVLCYHAIADLSEDPLLADYGIDRATFQDQLDSLLGRGFTFVDPDEAAAFFSEAGRLPSKAILLTFDDCYEELSEIAREVLVPRGIRAIAFAVSGMRSGTNEWDQAIGAQRLRLLGRNELLELRKLGVEIGCHSRSHRILAGLSDSDLAAETAGAADDLEALGLPRPRFFAYPYGESDHRSRAAVQSAGFLAAFGLSSAQANPWSDRFCLPRVEILARDAGWRFQVKTGWPRLGAVFSTSSAVQAARAKLARAFRSLKARAPV